MKDDIQAQVETRMKEIRSSNPSVSLDYLVQDSDHGKWGVILYIDYDFNTIGFDFIESEESWQRPEAIEQYNGLISDGYCVVIYAPSKVMGDLIKMLNKQGGRPNIRLATIEKTSGRHRTLKEMIEVMAAKSN